MLPIAIAVVEAETRDSWSWLLSLLVGDIGMASSREYTFISDQQKGLLPALEEVIPGVDHRFCVRHLYNNFRKKFPGMHLKGLMWKAAKATYPQEWERAMGEIQKAKPEAYDHLKEIPPKFWSKSAFRLGSKSDQLLNNMCETFNSVILKSREKPIITMLDEIIVYMMGRWAKNRKDAEKLGPKAVLPKIKKQLDKEIQDSGKWLPTWSGDKKFEVKGPKDKFVVDLAEKYYGCRKWMLTGIPCAHAISCISQSGENPEDYIPLYYRTEQYKLCYQPIVNPKNGSNKWTLTKFDDILPPPYRKPIGRPKKRRRKEADEPTKSVSNLARKGTIISCGACGEVGHNKRSCKNKNKIKDKANQQSSSTPKETDGATSQPTAQNQPTQPSQDANNQQGGRLKMKARRGPLTT